MGAMNSRAVMPRELRCAEYAFILDFNPWQHPVMGMNVHQLLAMIISLSNECGGTIYLTDDDIPSLKERHEVVETFEGRLKELIFEKIGLSSEMLDMIEMSIPYGDKRTWAAIRLKKSDTTLTYTAYAFAGDSQPREFHLDVHSRMYIQENAGTQSHNRAEAEIAAECLQKAPRYMLLTQNIQTTLGSNDDPSSAQVDTSLPESTAVTPTNTDGTPLAQNIAEFPQDTNATPLREPAETPDGLVDFVFCQRLDWSENKTDWESYVKVTSPNTEEIVESCALWKATQPMTVTPSKDAVRDRFASDRDMEETLSMVDTKEPGFAIVSKTWKFHITGDATEDELPDHICDILTVSNKGKVSFWVITSCRDQRDEPYQMAYLMTTGRMIKYQLVRNGSEELANMGIECHLFTPTSQGTGRSRHKAIKSTVDILKMQNHMLQFCDEEVNFECLQKALAMVILSKKSPLKRCVDDQSSITLSAQQAEVLIHKAKVNYVTGPAGSGKSWTAAYLYRIYGKQNSVYICSTKEFVEYLKFSGYEGTLVQSDQDLLREIQEGAFQNKTCVIIDDSHNFTCTRSAMKKLFQLLKKTKDMSLFIFADNDYQSFDRRRQQMMYDCIVDLTKQVLGQNPRYAYLTRIYRNTRKVASFVQSVIQDTGDVYEKIECGTTESGDGIECTTMLDIWRDSPENELVVYLENIYLSDTYGLAETAVLMDPSYTGEQIEECRRILTKHFPDSKVQSASVFPRAGVVVDTVSSFLGLDASLCIFILSLKNQTEGSGSLWRRLFHWGGTGPDTSIYNPCFKVFMASRATHKAVFVVPTIDAGLAQQLKFDRFEVYMKKNPAIRLYCVYIYRRTCKTWTL